MTRVLCALLLCACATVPAPPDPIYVKVDRRPEERALPPSPREEPLPPEFSEEEWVEPAEVGQLVARPGLHISESRAARDLLFRTRYDELRSVFVADQAVWKVQRKYYEERLGLAEQTIQSLQPTWWDLNKGTVFFWGGVFLGTGLTLSVTSIAISATR